MRSSALVLLLLSISAVSRGNIIDEAIEYAKELAAEVHRGVQQVIDAAEDSKTTIQLEHDRELTQLQAYSVNYVDKAKETAKLGKCKNLETAVKLLDQLNAKTGDRWDSCVNFTREVTDLGTYIRDTISNLTESELVVCNTIQNVSRCEGNFVTKWACVSEELQKSYPEVASQAKLIWDYIADINDYLEKIVSLILSCVTSVRTDIKSEANSILASQCNLSLK